MALFFIDPARKTSVLQAPSCASSKVTLQSPMPPEGDLQDDLGIEI